MRKLTTTLLFALAAALIAAPAFAQAPPSLPIQGYLANADGVPVDGMTELTLTLYDDGGNVLHTTTQQVAVDRGAFSTAIGDDTAPLDLAAFRDNSVVELGVSIDGGTELSPRFEIATAPFAGFSQYAGDAMTLEGLAADDFERAGQVDFGDLQNVPSGLDDGDTLDGLGCQAGEVASWDGAVWACSSSNDTLAGLGCGSGEVARWDGAAWSCTGLATVATTGSFADLTNVPSGLADGDDNTTYGAGAGITLSGTTFSLDTVALDNSYVNEGQANSISSTMVVDNSLSSDDLAAGSVGTSELASSSVTSAKIASGAVGSTQIADAAVATADIADNSVTAAKIASGAVGSSEIATNAVTNAKMADNSIGTNEIANGSVGNADLENDAVTAAKIRDDAVGTSEIADGAVTDAKIAGVDSTKVTWSTTGAAFTETCNGSETWRFVALGSCTFVGTSEALNFADCDDVGPGAICEYDVASNCSTNNFDGLLENCGSADLYLRLR